MQFSFQNCIPQYHLGHWKRLGEFNNHPNSFHYPFPESCKCGTVVCAVSYFQKRWGNTSATTICPLHWRDLPTMVSLSMMLYLVGRLQLRVSLAKYDCFYWRFRVLWYAFCDSWEEITNIWTTCFTWTQNVNQEEYIQ